MGGGRRNAARESEFFFSEGAERSGSTSGGDCTSNLHSEYTYYISICHLARQLRVKLHFLHETCLACCLYIFLIIILVS